MITLRNAAAVPTTEGPTVAAYGRFEALHRGHLRLLRDLREEAARDFARCVVVAGVGRAASSRLASTHQRVALFAAAGVDVLLLRREIRSPPDWNLLARLGASLLVTADAGVPPGPEAMRVRRVGALALDGERIDDGSVRSAVAAADFARAGALLGRPYAIDGRVVHGFHRGGPLGIPTANLRGRDQLLPPDGVYAVRAQILGQSLGGVANIGVKPTFGDAQRSVETHLLDFTGDLYGQRLEVGFVRRLRAERKFAGVDELLAQIRRDIAAARQILAES